MSLPPGNVWGVTLEEKGLSHYRQKGSSSHCDENSHHQPQNATWFDNPTGEVGHISYKINSKNIRILWLFHKIYFLLVYC